MRVVRSYDDRCHHIGSLTVNEMEYSHRLIEQVIKVGNINLS